MLVAATLLAVVPAGYGFIVNGVGGALVGLIFGGLVVTLVLFLARLKEPLSSNDAARAVLAKGALASLLVAFGYVGLMLANSLFALGGLLIFAIAALVGVALYRRPLGLALAVPLMIGAYAWLFLIAGVIG